MAARPVGQRKYRNVPRVVDDIRFDSTAEATRYLVLKARQAAGEISGLQPHPRFPLVVNGRRVCTYVADFVYVERASGQTIVEDVKGVKTAAYTLKKKLMAAVLGIDVQEVRA